MIYSKYANINFQKVYICTTHINQMKIQIILHRIRNN
jgi:hypothetical protein